MSTELAEPPKAEPTAETNDSMESPLFDKMSKVLNDGLKSIREQAAPTAPPKEPVKEVKATTPEPTKGNTEVPPTIPKIGDVPKPTVAEEPDPVIPNLSAKAADHFSTLKKSRDEFKTKALTYEKELQTLKTQLEEARKTQAPAAEVDAIKKELETTREQLRISNVERDPRFKQYFEGKRNQVLDYVKSRLPEADSSRIIKALGLPGDMRGEALRDLVSEMADPLAQSVIAKADSDLWALDAEKQAELAKGAKLYDEMQAHDKAQTEKQSAALNEKRSKAADAMIANARSFSPVFQEKEGDAAHNAVVANNVAFVRDFLAGKAPENLFMWTPVLAADGIHLRETVLPAKDAEIAKLQEQLKSYVKASPGPGDSDVGPGEAPPAPTSFSERITQGLRELGR